MRILGFQFVLGLILSTVPRVVAQEPANLEQLRQTLKDASELYESDLPKVQDKLAPLLAQLRDGLRQGTLTQESLRIYQDALLLQLRTQSKLLVDETGISAVVREMLVANPRLDDTSFNPREKLLVEKIRSAETGRLGLQSTPAGADVSYCGMPLGTTPLDVPLVAGTYRLRLSKEGFRSDEFEASIRPSEMLSVERPLRRRPLQVAMSIKAPSVRVSLNGKSVGVSRDYEAWLASLPPEQSGIVRAAPADWNPDRSSSSFVYLPEITAGDPLSLELQATCYVPKTLSVKIAEEEVDWNKPLTVVPRLLGVEMKRDIGMLAVGSTPSGGSVLLDGVPRGKTPATMEACAGTHRVQVVHTAGQYVKSVLVRRDEQVQVSGDLKPALAFLGVYSAAGESLTPSLIDWDPVASHLSAHLTAFSDPHFSADDVRAQKNGELPLAELVRPASSSDVVETAVAALSLRAASADLLLFGVRSGDGIVFRLYGTGSGVPDVIEVPNVDSASMDFLSDQINRAGRAASWLQTPTLDLLLLQSTRGLVVQRDLRPPAEARPPLAPGTLIRSVDQKPMDYAEFQSYLRTRVTGQSVTLQVASGNETGSPVVLPVRFAAAEYPWSTPQGFPNAIMATFRHIVERDPAAAPAQLARLSLARGLMQRGAWKSALVVLEEADLAPLPSGVNAGTVLYYRARCWEQLGDSARALDHYTRAAAYPDATLGTVDGMPIAELVQRRLEALKKSTQ